ncbi:MAG: hypothetical protein OXG23_15400 [Chloroflexi bacterium]|nr:hypothetical protein [Chloroflexota bacterium]
MMKMLAFTKSATHPHGNGASFMLVFLSALSRKLAPGRYPL